MAELIIDKDFLDMDSKVKFVVKNAPGKVISGLEKEGRRIRSVVKKATPYRAGSSYDRKKKKPNQHMRNRWKLSPVERSGGTYQTAIYSTAPHYHLVERGHLITPRRAKKGRTGFLGLKKSERVKIRRGKGKVDGTYFFKKTMDTMEGDIQNSFEAMVDDILGGIFK